MSLIDRAIEYAKACHQGTNHLYDGQDYYILHLKKVVHYANKYAPMYLNENEIETVVAACLCHDVIEDCRQTYNDVKKAVGERVANIVYAVTNEKGKTRSERANIKYYQGIRNVPFATYVKLCDRLANVDYSLATHSKMLEVYRSEANFMRKQLDYGTYKQMWIELEKMLFE